MHCVYKQEYNIKIKRSGFIESLTSSSMKALLSSLLLVLLESLFLLDLYL